MGHLHTTFVTTVYLLTAAFLSVHRDGGGAQYPPDGGPEGVASCEPVGDLGPLFEGEVLPMRYHIGVLSVSETHNPA